MVEEKDTRSQVDGMCAMVEEKDTGWRTLIEKQGIHQQTDILENYGIDSPNNVSELEKGVKVSPFKDFFFFFSLFGGPRTF